MKEKVAIITVIVVFAATTVPPLLGWMRPPVFIEGSLHFEPVGNAKTVSILTDLMEDSMATTKSLGVPDEFITEPMSRGLQKDKLIQVMQSYLQCDGYQQKLCVMGIHRKTEGSRWSSDHANEIGFITESLVQLIDAHPECTGRPQLVIIVKQVNRSHPVILGRIEVDLTHR
jgi:hypothetical protein